jgi:hypothetical protein
MPAKILLRFQYLTRVEKFLKQVQFVQEKAFVIFSLNVELMKDKML